jgi:hypothetical protein
MLVNFEEGKKFASAISNSNERKKNRKKLGYRRSYFLIHRPEAKPMVYEATRILGATERTQLHTKVISEIKHINQL